MIINGGGVDAENSKTAGKAAVCGVFLGGVIEFLYGIFYKFLRCKNKQKYNTN